MKRLLIAILLAFVLPVTGQYRIVKAPKSPYEQVWTFIYTPPEAKDSVNKKYPLIISFGGAGTTSTSVPPKASDTLRLVSEDGLPKRIKNGWDASAINPITNRRVNFVVIQAQDRWGCPWPTAMDYTLNYCLKTLNLPIDTNYIYVTGLSFGGSCSAMYASADSLHAKKITAVVSASPQGDFLGNLLKIPLIAKYGVPYRFWSGTLDGFTNNARTWLSAYTKAGGVGDLTTYVGGHGGWSALYGSGTKEPTVKWSYILPDGNVTQVNMYEWFASFVKDGTLPPVEPPKSDTVIYDIKNAKRITVETVEGKTVIFQ
jgi:hypothetical protein